MGLGLPDVRVRLSAEGEAQVLNALKKVAAESQRSGRTASRGFGQFNAALSGARALLAQLAAVASVGALVSLARSAANVADELGKMSQRVGASVTNLSALRAAAATADVSMETLQASFVIFNRRAAELERGSKEAVRAFAAIGVAVEDLKGLDAAERLDVVARAFGRLEDSPNKTALAFELFGRQAAALIPLLNDLSQDGLQGAIDRAREFGLLLSEDTARAAQAINDDFTIIKEQVIAGAARFVEGLAPAVHAVLGDVQQDLGANQDVWKQWGETVGRTVGLLVLTLTSLFDRVGTSIAKLASELGGLFSALSNLGRARAIQAETIARTRELEADFQRRERERLQRAENIGFASTRGAAGLPRLRGGTQEEAAPVLGKSEDEIERERQAIRRLEAERDALIEKQLQAEGRRHEVALQNIEQEAARLDRVLGELEGKGVPQGDREARVAALRASLVAAEQFQVESESAEKRLEDLAAERAAIEDRVAAGLLSQSAGTEKLLALEKKRLPVLQAQADALLRAARATGDSAAIAQAEQFAATVAKIGTNVEAAANLLGQLRVAAEDALEAGLRELFTSGIREAKSFAEAIRNLGLAVVDALQQILAAELAAAALRGLRGLFGGLFAGGGLVPAQGLAEGGVVAGPGSGTSDSVPAWLSSGEFVVRAAVVRQPGMLEALQGINRGLATPALTEYRGARRFADGGLVEGAGATRHSSELTVGLEPGLVVRDLQTPEGERAIVRILHKNRRSIG